MKIAMVASEAAPFVKTGGLGDVMQALPAELSKGLGAFGKFCIIWAMAAIGLNTNLAALLKNGLRPIFLGLCCWFGVAVVSLVVQHFLGIF